MSGAKKKNGSSGDLMNVSSPMHVGGAPSVPGLHQSLASGKGTSAGMNLEICLHVRVGTASCCWVIIPLFSLVALGWSCSVSIRRTDMAN